MSIQSEIDRINGAKASIKSAISSKGVTVPSDASIEDLPALVRSIPQEGGESVSNTFTATFDFDLANMEAKNPSHTAMEIAEAYRSGMTVQGIFVYSFNGDIDGNIIVPLSMVIDMGSYGIVQFNTTIMMNGVLMYISVDYTPETLTTTIRPISTLS